MRKGTPRRSAVAGGALMLVTFSIGLMLAVLVAGSASAKTPPKKTTSAKGPAAPMAPPAVSPADKFSAINGTVNAASDHEIVGSSAFPNFTTGAVDNYYTMAHAHVDNSPFAEGTASPFDTGPVGQTAAAGNFQQPQYADARWPGGPDKATYGSQGGPYADSAADNNRATANASEPSNALSGPGLHGTKTLALPVGFDGRLRQALSGWKTAWRGRLGLKKAAPKVTTPAAPVTVPSSPVKPPSVTTPSLPAVGGVTPPATVPKLPSAGAMGAPTRSPASVSLPKPPASLPRVRQNASPPSGGGSESALTSSTLATLVYKTGKSKTDTSETNTCKSDTVGTTGTTGTTTTTTTTTTEKPKRGTCELVLTGESSVGRVTLGGGQIVIEGIHVTASITNDGTTPSYDAKISVASASIGGIPVTIDENGVHVAGQGQGLPYQQASAALNSALNKAGIQIFLVAPEVTNCSQSGGSAGGGSSTSTTSTTTSTTSTDQSGGSSSCGGQSTMSTSSCDQSGSSSGSGGAPGVPAPPTAAPTSTESSTTTQSSPCGQTDMGASCDQTGTGTGGGTSTSTTTTTATPTPSPSPTQSTTTNQSSTTANPSSCGQSGMTGPTGSCTKGGSGTGTTTGSNDQSAMTTTDSTSPASGGTFQFGPGPGTNNAGEETVTATGVHIVFNQPVSPSGVPAQYVEHILGEVFVDSLATPATPLANVPFSSSSLSSSSSPSLSSSCLGSSGRSGLKASGSGLTSSGGGGSSLAGSASSGSGAVSPAASSLGSSSQPGSGTGSTGNSLPASFARALHKPLWLLLAYVVWQLLVIGTGWSLWNWRRGGTT